MGSSNDRHNHVDSMKIFVVSALLACAMASPQRFRQFQPVQQFQQPQQFQQFQEPQQFQQPQGRQLNQEPFVPILSQENTPNELGNFQHRFEADNGINVQGAGFTGSQGQTNMEGSYSFPLPDGSFAEVRYVADENGFRVESPLLPVAPPAPPHVAELLRIAEEQRAQGIVFN